MIHGCPSMCLGPITRTPFQHRHSEGQPPRLATPAVGPLRHLGGVDGFDEDEAESKGNDGAVVLGRLLATERNSLEALELAHKLLDPSAGAIERSGEEPWPVPG